MSVPEQIPTVSYTANGTTTNFPITFELSDERYLVVTKNMEIPPVGAYTVLNGDVIFGVAPNEGDIITLMRDTVLDRETNYQNYDNSFRPEAVNYDLDKIWHVLQEQNLIDAKLLARLKEEIEWRRTHDANFDELSLMRDSQIFSGLKQYLDTILAGANPNIFDGITAGIVFALDGKSIQTHIELIYADLLAARADIDAEIERATLAESLLTDNLANEVLRATTVEQNIQAQVSALGTGNKAYLTYAAMDADKANIPANSKVTVTNDATSSNNGDWQWNGTSFTKSVYDPLTQANTYTDTKTLGVNTHLIDSIKAFDSSLVFKSVVSNGASVPVSPATGDCYLAKDTGTTFSIEVEQGQLLIKTATGWRVGDFLEKFRADLEAKGGACQLTTLSSYTINGYINSSGVFTASGAGFKLTYFKPVKAGDTLKFSARGSISANVISFWDANRAFISGVLGNDSNAERSVVVPANAVYVRVSNNSTANASPYCYIDLKGVIVDSNAITPDSFTLIPSLNLAKTSLIVADKYVNNAGAISNGVGWEYIKIPVVAGSTYTFGRFTINSGGYFAFYDASSVYISGTATSFSNGLLPVTVVAPVNAAFLLIDIKRPADTGENRALLTVNAGSTLIDYVEPVDTITRIKGYLLAGSGGGGDVPLPEDVVVQGGNATLADIISDSLTTGALIANLPTSPTGLEVGQAYIDSGFIKVVT